MGRIPFPNVPMGPFRVPQLPTAPFALWGPFPDWNLPIAPFARKDFLPSMVRAVNHALRGPLVLKESSPFALWDPSPILLLPTAPFAQKALWL